MIEEKVKKIRNIIISFFKSPKEVIRFFLPIVLTIVLLIPVPYYIKIGGGVIDVDKKIMIKNQQNSAGSLQALYVSEVKGNILLYLLSYVVPSFEKIKISNVTLENEEEDNYNYREKLSFISSADTAVKVAFEAAGKEVKIKDSKLIVLYVDKKAKTGLKVGDEILKVNDYVVKDYAQMESIINSKNQGDKLSILVRRNNEEITVDSILVNIDGFPRLGIILSNQITYQSDPKVEFNFSENQVGPSGGLMLSLSIYNKLVNNDITKGKRVFGTGAINQNGVVLPIGGIKHKLIAANKNKADIVLVPKDNYKEALKIMKSKNYKFKLIKVESFNDAIERLG